MKAADVMTARVISVAPDASVLECVRLMLQHRISGLPVIDTKGALVGVVTEGDFLRRVEAGTQRKRPRWLEFLTGPGRLADEYVQSHGRKVSDVMTPEPVTIDEDTPVEEVVRLMEGRRIKRLPVMRGIRSSASSAAPTCCVRSRASGARRRRRPRTTRRSARASSPISRSSRGRRATSSTRRCATAWSTCGGW
jgi:CBS domain-containing protein